MPTLDLPAGWQRTLEALLAAHLPDAEVWAYGSRVNGGAHAGSDLDLAVRSGCDSPDGRQLLGAFKRALEDSDLPITVEVRRWSQLPENFRCEIERSHFVVQTGRRKEVLGAQCSDRNETL